MSEQNVDVIGKLYEFFEGRDLEPAFPDHAHPPSADLDARGHLRRR